MLEQVIVCAALVVVGFVAHHIMWKLDQWD